MRNFFSLRPFSIIMRLGISIYRPVRKEIILGSDRGPQDRMREEEEEEKEWAGHATKEKERGTRNREKFLSFPLLPHSPFVSPALLLPPCVQRSPLVFLVFLLLFLLLPLTQLGSLGPISIQHPPPPPPISIFSQRRMAKGGIKLHPSPSLFLQCLLPLFRRRIDLLREVFSPPFSPSSWWEAA